MDLCRKSATLLALLTFIGTASVGCGNDSESTASTSSAPEAVETVKVTLPYAPNGLLAAIIAATENGIYKKHGLDVEILVPASSSSPIRSMAAGNADIGFISSLEITTGIAQGLPIKQIGLLVPDSGSGLLTGVGNGIDLRNLKTLEGKKIGYTGNSGTRTFLEDALTRNGVDLSKVEIINVGFGGIQALADKRIDAHGDTVAFRPPAYLRAIGKPLDDTSSYQFRTYAEMGSPAPPLTAVTTTTAYLERKGEVVKRFMGSLQEALQWGIDNPEEAARLEVKRFPELDFEQTLAEWKRSIPLITNEDTDKNGLCWQNPDTFNTVATFLAEKGLAVKKVTVEEGMTNEYIPTK